MNRLWLTQITLTLYRIYIRELIWLANDFEINPDPLGFYDIDASKTISASFLQSSIALGENRSKQCVASS